MSIRSMGGGSIDVSTESLKMWHDNAARNQAQSLRTDSRRSVGPVTAARVALKQFAIETATKAARESIDSGFRCDEATRDQFARDIVEGMAHGLGYGEVDGEIRCDSLRTDAAWFSSDALLSRDSNIIRPKYAKRAVSESIPVRMVEAWKERYEIGGMSYSGEMTVMQPHTNDVAYADVQTNARYRDMFTFGVKTRTNWMQMMQSSYSAVNVVAEKAEAARITEREFREQALVNGVAGIDFNGVKQMGCTNYYSQVNYATETNMDVIYADLIAGVQAIVEAAGDRGDAPNAALIGTRLARAIQRKSNFNAGGTANGNNLFAALAMSSAALGATLTQAGITTLIAAPSLNRYGADNRDGMLLFDMNDDQALRQVVGMTLAPVRTHENLTAQETLFIMRHGGLDLHNSLAIGVFTARVV